MNRRILTSLMPALFGSVLASSAFAFSPPDFYDVRRVDLDANDIAYDHRRNSVLATVPSIAGVGLGNSLVRIDAVTGQITASVFVGSEPGPIAVATDASTAYIGLNGSPAVRKFDLQNNTASTLTPLGRDPNFGFLYAEDIAVKPNDPNTFVASLKRTGVTPRHGGVAAYDETGRLPNVTQDHTGSNRIVFSDDPNTLYGLNNETTEFGLRTIALDASGVREVDVVPNVGSGFGTADIGVVDGLVYLSNGQVFDPKLGIPVGTFNAPQTGGLMFLKPSESGIAYGLAAGQFFLDPLTLVLFDQSTFVPIESYNLPGVGGDFLDLEVLGDGRVALLTRDGFFGDPGGVFLLTPVPEPETWMTLTTGVALLIFQFARRRCNGSLTN